MIRVNLARNRVSDHQATSKTAAYGTSFSSSSSDSRDALVKVALLLLPVLGLMLYENQTIHALNAEQIRLQNEVNKINQEAQAKAKEIETVKDIEVQAKELDDKLKILKTLSRLRLREVKTLDFVQNAIPEKVWLKSLMYEADKDKVDQGKFVINGLAVSTEDLTDFVKRLEESAYMSDVIVMKNQEVSPSSSRKVLLRDFNFTAQVEVQP